MDVVHGPRLPSPDHGATDLTVTIRQADFVDVAFVAAWMRERDRREIAAIMADPDPLGIARIVWECSRPPAGSAWCARIDDQPVAVFGYAARHPTVYDGWMFGTRRTRRVVPEITRFVKQFETTLYKSGARRLEVRALLENKTATNWLMNMGAHLECELPEFGMNGETFVQLAWVGRPGRQGRD